MVRLAGGRSMLLHNPERARRLDDIIASLPDDRQVRITMRLAELNRTLAKQTKADADLVDNLARILRSQNPQAKRLRKLLREVARG
jgi:hypothetical protein